MAKGSKERREILKIEKEMKAALKVRGISGDSKASQAFMARLGTEGAREAWGASVPQKTKGGRWTSEVASEMWPQTTSGALCLLSSPHLSPHPHFTLP